eukprot:TRINITY_DN6888_c1_g2_i5.p1 TRINITY_DN6888_c1_g2~~TRINITY_DN6888_c1_g2_i5.p1  ORF type:complete len:717 (-),score=31.59 TRINITY_DN6888_c1_g2_i5:5-2155(-)
MAAWLGYLEMVQLLLNADDIDINQAADDETTPLFIAAQKAYLEVVRSLLQTSRVDVNQTRGDGTTPLWVAAQNGHSAVVRALLEIHGIDVNKARNGGETPLWMAAQNGHVAVVQILLEALDINVNKARNDGMTPLCIAVQQEHMEVVRALLQARDVNVNQAAENGATPIWTAVQNRNAALVRILLEAHNIVVNQVRNDGITPLFMAVQNGDLEVVRALLQAPDVDVNQARNTGATLLILAVQSGCLEVVKSILEAPYIDVNLARNDGYTPLHMAAQTGHLEMVQVLLEAPGINVNQISVDGSVPLWNAVRLGHIDIVRMLLAASNSIVISVVAIHLCQYSCNLRYMEGWEYKAEGLGFRQLDFVHEREKLAQLLLEHEIQIKAIRQDPYQEALIRPKVSVYCKILELFVRDPRLLINLTRFNKTMLIAACQFGHARFVEILLRQEDLDINMAPSIESHPAVLTALHATVISKIEREQKLFHLFKRINLDVSKVGRHVFRIDNSEYEVEGSALVFAVLVGISQDDSCVVREIYSAMHNFNKYTLNIDLKFCRGDMNDIATVLHLVVEMHKFSLTQELFTGLAQQKISKNQLKFFIQALVPMSCEYNFQSTIQYFIQNEFKVLEFVSDSSQSQITIDLEMPLFDFVRNLISIAQFYHVFDSNVVVSIINTLWSSVRVNTYLIMQSIVLLVLLLIYVTVSILHQFGSLIQRSERGCVKG